MSYRYIYMRIADQKAGPQQLEFGPFDLWWAAKAAAEETIQGSPLVPAWLTLFQDHLSQADTVALRWAEDLAASAEMRRAYSALYGRFFGRAFLAYRLGFTDFVPIESGGARVGNLVQVRRVRRGDGPDWIAWDPRSRSYVLAEAKGRLGGAEGGFLSHARPKCITAGKAQFERVEVRDTSGRRVQTKNWVAANLWSTDRRKRDPVCLLWDPEGEGEQLLDDEVPRHVAAIRRHRVGAITAGLGHLGFPNGSTEPRGVVVQVAAEPKPLEPPPAPPVSEEYLQVRGSAQESLRAVSRQPAPRAVEGDQRVGGGTQESFMLVPREPTPRSRERHQDAYMAAIITRSGIRAIVDPASVDAAFIAQERARSGEEPALIYGVSANALAEPASEGTAWSSASGIVSGDSAGLFDLAQVEIEA